MSPAFLVWLPNCMHSVQLAFQSLVVQLSVLEEHCSLMLEESKPWENEVI